MFKRFSIITTVIRDTYLFKYDSICVCVKKVPIREISLTTGAGGLKNWAKFTPYFL